MSKSNREVWISTSPSPTGLALFRKIGFTVTDYRELYAPNDMTEDRFPVTADWAKDYPAEQVWWLEKSDPAT